MYKIVSLIAFFAVPSISFATGLKQNVFNCSTRAAGEAASSIQLQKITMSAPGGPSRISYQANASASWLGGTHASAEDGTDVRVSQSTNGSIMKLSGAGFKATVTALTTTANGKIKTARVTGSFKDPKTGLTGKFPGGTFYCK